MLKAREEFLEVRHDDIRVLPADRSSQSVKRWGKSVDGSRVVPEKQEGNLEV